MLSSVPAPVTPANSTVPPIYRVGDSLRSCRHWKVVCRTVVNGADGAASGPWSGRLCKAGLAGVCGEAACIDRFCSSGGYAVHDVFTVRFRLLVFVISQWWSPVSLVFLGSVRFVCFEFRLLQSPACSRSLDGSHCSKDLPRI